MNEEAMIDVLAAIEREEVAGQKVALNMGAWYSQSDWCGTTACLAGFAGLQAGWRFLNSGINIEKDGHIEATAVVGKRVLDLTEDQAYRLFFMTSSENLTAAVAEMMGVDEQVLRDKVHDRATAR